jgi:sugar phosphate isomerase/epimerase
LEEDLLRYESLGFDSIGIWRRKMEDAGTERAVDLIHESNLSVSSLHHAGGFTGDGSSVKDAVKDTYKAIKLAAQVKAGVLLIHPGAVNNHMFNHVCKVYQSALDEIVPYAEALDVQLAIEPVLDQSNSQFTFHQSIDHTIDLLSANPTLGIALDLYHVGMDSETFTRLPEFVDRIKLVQLADRTRSSWSDQKLAANRRQSFRLPLGDGEVDIHAWLRKLRHLGYNGSFELEVYGTEVSDCCVFELLDQTLGYLAMPTLRRVL